MKRTSKARKQMKKKTINEWKNHKTDQCEDRRPSLLLCVCVHVTHFYASTHCMRQMHAAHTHLAPARRYKWKYLYVYMGDYIKINLMKKKIEKERYKSPAHLFSVCSARASNCYCTIMLLPTNYIRNIKSFTAHKKDACMRQIWWRN